MGVAGSHNRDRANTVVTELLALFGILLIVLGGVQGEFHWLGIGGGALMIALATYSAIKGS